MKLCSKRVGGLTSNLNLTSAFFRATRLMLYARLLFPGKPFPFLIFRYGFMGTMIKSVLLLIYEGEE